MRVADAAAVYAAVFAFNALAQSSCLGDAASAPSFTKAGASRPLASAAP